MDTILLVALFVFVAGIVLYKSRFAIKDFFTKVKTKIAEFFSWIKND